jgi:serine/threonine protein kinase
LNELQKRNTDLTDSLPTQIGRYAVDRELGRGAMGTVYEARDPVLGRQVAIKTIALDLGLDRQEADLYRERFRAEARAAASLSHPGIVIVYDVGEDAPSRQLYMALEYLLGETLEARILREGKLEWRPALRIAGDMARALHHAHVAGVVHRDVKPANIMLLESDETKILDFGIARLPTSRLTTGGESFGSPAYMSPEAALEERMDGRSDLFSLGIVLYEMLTGARPFTGSNIPTILTRVAYENPELPSARIATLPPELDRVLTRLLAKDPKQRYPNGEHLADDLDDVLARRPPRHLEDWKPQPWEPRTIAKHTKPLLVAPTPDISTARDGRGPADTQRASLGLSLPEGKRVSLAILDGPQQGCILGIDQPRVLIGRLGGMAGAEIEIPDPEISRAHASLEFYGKKVLLRDLESTNGTFVEEQRIHDHELEHQSEFRTGRTRFMLVLADRDA